MNEQRKRELLKNLVSDLCAERDQEGLRTEDIEELWNMFRALVNTRPPQPAQQSFLEQQDELLQAMIGEAGIHTAQDALPAPANPQLLLWRGDITTLATDAIVNAANSQMLGCWVPGHHCIDNAIHTFAGVQLRLECARLMAEQGHEEPTGQAKIAPAFNLPSKYVIHTVGPIAGGHATAAHREQLASCYRSCLDLAAENGLSSLAFCCISTGLFGFPKVEAAEIAVRTTSDWLAQNNSSLQVVFNVFGKEDELIYRDVLGI